MKKKLLILGIVCTFLISGCGIKFGSSDSLKDIEKKYKNLKSYHLTGELEIVNNEDVFNYTVDVQFKKDDNYKVSLINKSNSHEQVILKNTEGVYVITPSLNKSFKFQSNWPYNNSQVYLIKSIIDDIKNDKERTLTKSDNSIIYTTNVNYPNNRKLVKQNVTFDKDLNIKEVDVVDDNNISQMKMTFTSIDLSPSIDDKTFNLDTIITNNTENTSSTEETSSIEDIIYPLYLPSGTKLIGEEKIVKTDGERIIMTFDGEKSFTLVEETISTPEEFEIIPTFGEPCILTDTVASLTNSSISWSSGNIDYYIVSSVMSQDELLDVARSISSIPVMK